jgi:putative sigma-54 modulation protein
MDNLTIAGERDMILLKVQHPNMITNDQTITQVEKAFKQAVDRFAHIIRETDITFLDVNGPRGGLDKRCRVQLRLLPRGIIVVRTTATTMLDAANIACDKIRQLLSKRLSKRNSARRSKTKVRSDNI